MVQNTENEVAEAKQATTKYLTRCMKVVIIRTVIKGINLGSAADSPAASNPAAPTQMMMAVIMSSFRSLLKRRRRRGFSNCGIKQGVTTTN